MSNRKTLSALVLVSALAMVCGLPALITAQTTGKVVLGGIKGKVVLGGIKTSEESFRGTGSTQTFITDDDGKFDLTSLPPGKYALTVDPLSPAQKAAIAGGEGYNFIAVTITGDSLVGKTKTRSLNIKKGKFVNPHVMALDGNAAARTRATPPDTYTNTIEFEIKPLTGGRPPEPVQGAIVKSKSNIVNN
jgi:hypothetical protein